MCATVNVKMFKIQNGRFLYWLEPFQGDISLFLVRQYMVVDYLYIQSNRVDGGIIVSKLTGNLNVFSLFYPKYFISDWNNFLGKTVAETAARWSQMSEHIPLWRTEGCNMGPFVDSCNINRINTQWHLGVHDLTSIRKC